MKKNQPSDIHKARAEFAQELMRPVERGLEHTLRRAKDVYEQQNTSVFAAMIVAVEKDREAKVIELHANYDDLTGLLRRGAFTTKVEQQILSDPTRQGVMVFFDIDKFKSVNDSFGHEAGDEVLQTFAQAIQKKIGNSGTVGRWGGEEIVVFLPKFSEDQVLALFDECKFNLDFKSKVIPGHNFHITASGGVSALVSGESGIKEAISRADAAMYYKKHKGRDGIVKYTSQMQEFMQAVKAKEARLKVIQTKANTDVGDYINMGISEKSSAEREAWISERLNNSFAELHIVDNEELKRVYKDAFVTMLIS